MHLRLLNCPEIKTKAVWVTRCPLKWQEFALLCLQCKYPAALSPSTLSAFVVVLFIYLCHQPSVSVFRKGRYSWWMRERGFWRQNLYPHALINLCAQKCHQDMNVSEWRRFRRSLIFPTALQISYFMNPIASSKKERFTPLPLVPTGRSPRLTSSFRRRRPVKQTLRYACSSSLRSFWTEPTGPKNSCRSSAAVAPRRTAAWDAAACRPRRATDARLGFLNTRCCRFTLWNVW